MNRFKILFQLPMNIEASIAKGKHSVLERIWIKGSYLSQWLPQVKGDP